MPQTDNQAQFFEGVDCGRESFGACFTALRQNQTLSADNILSYYKILSTRHPIGMAQFMAGVAVFAELDLIRIQKKPYSIVVNKDARADLNTSAIYRYLCEYGTKQ